MIHSYLTTAARNFKKNKVHTLINMTGLGVGIMTSILAIMFVLDEMSFDKLHGRRDRLYRLNKINTEPDGSTTLTAESSGMMGPTLVEEFPEVEKIVRYQPWFNAIMLSNKDRNVMTLEGELVFADSTFFDVFNFRLLRGNPKTVLTRPLTIVLTGKMAKGLFGDEDPVGKTITGVNGLPFEITGIVEEAPRNSHMQFAGLMSWTSTVPNLGALNFEWMNNWIAQGITTYVLLKEDASARSLESKFPKFMQDYMPTRVDKYKLYLQRFDDIYLNSYNVTGADMSKSGNVQYVNLFLIIAGFILFIACVNYINICTSKATRRAREVGMRKTMGASRRQLVYQFLGESLLLTFLSACLAVLMLYLAVPVFNELAGKSLPMSLLLDKTILFCIAALILLVGFASGLYPSLVIASFNPSEVLRATTQSKITGNWPRYVLIIFQFTISIIMIAGTLVMYRQIKYVLSKDLGFDKEHVLVLNLTDDIFRRRSVFQEEINALAGVMSTSVGRTALGRGSPSTYVIPEGFKPDEIEIRMFPADGNFQKTYGLEMAMGRFFDPTLATDSNSLVINEALAKRLKWEDPTKKTIKFNEGQPALPVIGVLKDFYFASLYEEVEPLVMWISPRNQRNLSVRFSGNPSTLLSSLETKWKEYESRYPFRFYFVDQQFAKSYESEEKLFETVITFAGLSIFIACLGLYGLVSYTIEQRTKEFGIRKVLGASVANLSLLVNKKFILMVMLAAAVAIPAVMPFVEKWLQKFAFKTEVGPVPFVLAVLITMGVTIVAVSIHAIKVAMANPANSLRRE